jgi:hemoglobin/transferrin/lactoferrin receptor protein
MAVSSRLRLLCGVAGAALASLAGPAPAQVPSTTLDPVTVTATKTPHRVDDVPASVNVIGTEEIERRAPRTMNDVFGDVPGVEITGGPRRSGMDVNIRGLDGQRVVTTIDGARQNFDAGHKGRFFLDPDLLKQVEVLKGPASTLYGSGAVGGVIAMRTKDASDFLEPGETAALRGKYGYSSARREPLYSATAASRVGPHVEVLGNMTYRFSGTMQQGGDRELVDSAERLAGGLLKVGVDPGNGHKVGFGHNLLNEHGNTPSNANSNVNNTDVFRMDRRTEQNTTSFNYGFESADAPWVAPNFTLYRTTTYVRENRLDNATPRLDETNLATTGFDLRNTSKAGRLGFTDHTLTYGVEYFADSQQGRRNNAPRAGYPGANNYVTGFYVQDEIVMGPFSLIPGARFDSYELSSDASSRTNEESRLSPRLGGVWRVAPWVSLFASYAEAFRAPSLTEMFLSGLHFPGNTFINNPNLKPETVKTVEAGPRFRFNDVLTSRDSLRLRGSVFYTKAEDLIELFIAGANAQYQNIAEATLRGAEAEAVYDTPRWFAGLGLSAVRGVNQTNHRPLNSVPGDRLTSSFGGKLPEWDLLGGVRSQFVARQEKVDPTMFDTAQPTGGYMLHGLFASWQPSQEILRGIRVDAGVDNLFDKAYRRHTAQSVYQEGRDIYGAVSYTMKF